MVTIIPLNQSIDDTWLWYTVSASSWPAKKSPYSFAMERYGSTMAYYDHLRSSDILRDILHDVITCIIL